MVYMKQKKTYLDTIIKRDGQEVKFNDSKIEKAIEKALRASGEYISGRSKGVTKKVVESIRSTNPCFKNLTVELVQDEVEKALIAENLAETAKRYILYREQHAQIRRLVDAETVDIVDRYLDRSDWQVKENSNMAFSLQGLNNHIASEVSKVYWLDKVYPSEVKQAHLSGDIHIHDLNLLSVYCVGWDLQDLLRQGFSGVPGKVQSKPAKHFRSALGQIVNFFYTLQGEAAGAQAFANVDTLLAPFIWYDHLSYNEVKQALQEFVFNINVPTRVGFQTPFTNITLDLVVPAHYKDMSVLVGGRSQKEKYKDFQREMDMFNKAFLEVMSEGDASGRVFTFPIPTYNITSDFDWEDDRVSYLWETAAKYGIPYFSNFINSDMSPDDARSMCCRLRIDNRELKKRGGGLFGANPLTGSVGVVTMNLPSIAKISKDKEQFFSNLTERMNLAKSSLEIKRKVLERYTEHGLYPYTKHYLKNIKKAFGAYWQNHFSTIGLVGMNEACLLMFNEDITTEKGHDFAKETLDFMRNLLSSFQEETGHNYNLEATPAEGTSYRLARLDQQRYPNMIFANGLGRRVSNPYYTNSTHVPVNYSSDIFEVLNLQDGLQVKYTGGTVIHLFISERIKDSAVVKRLVRKICEQYHLPYFTISPTFSVCQEHGYQAGETETCPTCGASCEVYARVVGYLRPIDQWHQGKRAEYHDRSVADAKELN